MVFIDGTDIIYLVNRSECQVFHTDLLSLIDERQSAEHEVHGSQEFLALERKISVRNVVADTARLVVVFDDIGQISDIADTFLRVETAFFVIFRCDLFVVVPSVRTSTEYGRGEIKHTGKISVASDEIRKFFFLFIENLTYRKSIVWFESMVTHLAEEFSDTGCILKHIVDAGKSVRAVNRVIFEWKFFLDIDDRVNTESTDSTVKPPVDVFVNFLAYFRVFPVKIRLFFVEDVEILFVRMSRERFPD